MAGGAAKFELSYYATCRRRVTFPLNLTGMTVQMVISPSNESNIVITTGTSDPKLIIDNPANGQVVIYMSIGKIQSFQWMSAPYQLDIQDTLGDWDQWLQGKVRIVR